MKLTIFFLLFIPAAIAVGMFQQEYVLPAMRGADNLGVKILIGSGGALCMAATFWGVALLTTMLPDRKAKRG